MKTVKTARRTAIEHSFLAASIVAAGALFKDAAASDVGKPVEKSSMAAAAPGEAGRETHRVAVSTGPAMSANA